MENKTTQWSCIENLSTIILTNSLKVIKIDFKNDGSGNHEALTSFPGAFTEIIKAVVIKNIAKASFNNNGFRIEPKIGFFEKNKTKMNKSKKRI